MSRPVHYHASGSGSLAFDCYWRAMRPHTLAVRAVEYAHPIAHNREESRARHVALRAAEREHPRPRRHTDLRRVTCTECWRQIAKLAQNALGIARRTEAS